MIGKLYIHPTAFFIGYACIIVINKSMAREQAQALKNSPGRRLRLAAHTYVYGDYSRMCISTYNSLCLENKRQMAHSKKIDKINSPALTKPCLLSIHLPALLKGTCTCRSIFFDDYPPAHTFYFTMIKIGPATYKSL